MTKTVLAGLAAAIVASTALTSAAEAGGIRLGFGFPLGSFVARPHSPGAYGGGHSRYDRYQAQEAREARKALKLKQKRELELAQARKLKAAQMAKAQAQAETVKTAKIEEKSTVSDAPVINVPGTPAKSQVEKPVETAAIQPEPVAEVIKAEEPQTELGTQTASKPDKVEVNEKAKQVCRRFSALIGDLIDVPCQ